jgi:hypothetical protein
VPLNGKHEKGIEFIKRIQDSQEIPRISMRGYGQEIAKRWGNEGGELLFGEEFYGLLAQMWVRSFRK